MRPQHLEAYDYWEQARPHRIDALTRFLRIATWHATHNDPHGWWAHHVTWALRRLEACGYTFPDVDPNPIRHDQTRLAA